MVLTNAEKQRRWRQRHSDRRRAVARITTMLMRPSHTERSAIEAKVGWNTVTLDTYFLKLADLICNVLKTDRGDQATALGAGDTSPRSQVGTVARPRGSRAVAPASGRMDGSTASCNLAVACSGQAALNLGAPTFTSNHSRAMAEDPPATQRRQQGNSRAYLIGRLKRSNQADLAAAVEAGTVSAFAAAVQCGLAKRPPSKAAVTHQARKRQIRLQAIAGGGLSNGEMMELWLGPSLNGSLFNSRQELEQAWKQHRDEIMARWGRQGRRPQIWWELEAPALAGC